MKNCFRVIIAILCICLLFCGCGKSEVDSLIENMGLALENENYESFFEFYKQTELYELNEEQISTIEGYKAEVFNDYYETIEDAVAFAKMEEAFTLCDAVLLVGFNEEQNNKIEEMKIAIEEMCFDGTFIVKPEYLSNIEPLDTRCVFTYSNLVEDKSNIAFTVEYDKRSECEVAAQEYKDYLNQNFIYLGVEVDGSTLYEYADENGRYIAILVGDPESRSSSTCLFIEIDYDLFDISRMDIGKMSELIKP